MLASRVVPNWKGSQLRRKKPHLVVSKRAAPGASPGTLIPDPNAAETRISAICYGAENIAEAQNCKTTDIADLRGKAPVLWIDVSGLADVTAIEAVGEIFGLHQLALEDVINVHQRPKAEAYESYLFIVFQMLSHGQTTFGEQVSMFIGDGYVLTFQERSGDCFDPVRDRLRRAKGRIRQLGPDYLGYALIDAAIDSYFPILETLGEEIEALEDDVVANPKPILVDRLHRIKRELLALRRAVWPTREMLNTLIRDELPQISETTRPYLRDCYDHAIQLMDIVETYREIASSLLDVYLSSLSARMNEVMKVLTIIATIFIPLGFVASLYGMNFDRASPLNMPELGWRFGYPFALAVMMAMAVGLIWFFRRRGWIGSDAGSDK
jgi:magnesium transporter